MLFVLGVLIAIGSAGFFGVLGGLTLWGGLVTMRTEVPRDYVRTQASGGSRAMTVVLVVLPLVITGIFGLLAMGQFLRVAFGLV
ncbi:MAG: hypothetical protein AB4911_00360 [Oscillochloridaceae bacterium umkhey_bin13]